MPNAFDVTGDGFPEIVVGENEGPWHPIIPNDPPRIIIIIDAEEGVVLWEQLFYDRNLHELTVANHDGDLPYEIFNVGHFFLTAWEPTLEDRGSSAPVRDGIGADLEYCS